MQKKNDLLKAIFSLQNKLQFILAIDSGNTNNRFSLFDREKNAFIIEYEKDFSKLTPFGLNDENTIAVQSAVIENPDTPDFKIHLYPHEFRQENQFFDMPIHYAKTLGEDRLVGAFEIFKQYPQEKNLLIDSGSFTTADLISSQGFMGGYIFPGKMLLEKTYAQGAKLHQANIVDFSSALPQMTNDAISHGAFLSFIAPLFYLIETLKPDRIILTGFNANLIKKALEEYQKFESNRLLLSPNLILKALTTFAMGVINYAHSSGR